MCKKIIYMVYFVLMLSVVNNASADLVAHWPLDADAIDIFGGHDGILVGGAQFTNDPERGRVLSVDGVDGHVEVPHDDDMVFSSADSYTIMAWIYLEALPGSWQTVAAKSRDQGTHYGIWITDSGEWMGGGWENRGSPAITQTWVHIAYVQDGAAGTGVTYIDGTVDWSGGPRDGTGAGDFWIGGAGGVTEFLQGMIDEVRVYNHALTEEEIQTVMLSGGEGYPHALSPDPEDDALLADTWATLSWRPGDFAVSHDVYLGDNFDDVNSGAESAFQGNQVSNMFIAGFAGFAYPDGLVPGTTYYWRIDEVNDADPNSPWKGDVWSFWIPPYTAYAPNPADDAKFVPTDAELSWTAGFGAKLHTVYFGDNFDDVNNAVVGFPQSNTTYTPGTLELEKTYYWRVDEFDGIATLKGDVWSFSTIPNIAITDPSLIGWWKLDEGMGTTAVDWSGHGNHGTFAGDPQWEAGQIGGALEFDGGDDYVNFVNTSNWPAGTSSRSMCGWGKTDSVADGWRWIAAYGSAGTSLAMFIGMNGTSLYGGGYGDDVLEDDFWEVGVWHHICLTYDGNVAKLYADGVEVDSQTKNWDLALGRAHIGRQVNDLAEFWDGLVDDVRIYNRVLTPEEIKLAMRGDPLVAWDPHPTNGSTPYIRDATPFSWSPGDNASQHDVYFGTDRGAVADADVSDTTGIYRGRQGVTIYTPAEGVEWGGGAYYWRIDEYNTDATISKGNVWSFTVADFIGIDDIEDYNDYPPDEIFSTWIDGWEVPTNGSLAGHPDPPFAETGNVHGGSQSMPVYYENNFKYSEITMTLVWPRNWTEEGVGVLSLWVYGDAANAAERMYVNLNGIATVYHDNSNAAQIATWTEWTIDLQEFAAQGVNLANVNTISIGFGDKNNIQAGGSGLVFFDDIRLYRPAESEPQP